MYQGILDVPTLHSFEDALAHFKKITPIRGSELRPLCRTTNGRRKQHVQIVHSLHPMEAVACRLYNTDVVTFYAKGDIVINTGGSATRTTNSFINSILWRCVEARTQKGFSVISAYRGGPKAVLTAPTAKITICLQDGEVCFPDTRAGFTAYYLKRAPYLLRRKEIAPFRKFVRACAKLIDPKDYHGKDKAQPLGLSGRLYDFMLDQESWNAALELLLPVCIYSTYRGGRFIDEVDIKKLDALLDDAIKYRYAEKLFEVREVETPFLNDNHKYLGKGAL